MRRLGTLGLVAGFLASSASAQEAGAWVVLRAEAPPDSPFVARLVERLEADGATVVAEASGRRERVSVGVDRLRALAEVERALVAARAEAARLDEADALARLARARAAIAELGDVPGVARFAAEIELLIGLVAAQAGRPALATQSLRAAVALDATREIGAAEAPPDVVALADRLRREVATGPRGRFVVRAARGDASETAIEGAEVYVDDHLVGAAPVDVEATVGRHVVRVEAPGHRPFARFVDVFEGERAPWVVVLAPTARHARRARVDEAIAGRDLEAVVAELAALDEDARVVFLFASDARATAVVCTREGCRGPSPVRDDGSIARSTARAGNAALRRARDEANRPPPIVRESAPSRRRARRGVPPALAAVAAASIAAAVVATRSDGAPQRLSLHIDGTVLTSASAAP